MKLSLIFFSLLLLLITPIQEAWGQSYSWATKGASTGSDAGIAVTTDQQGNIYSLGYYTSASITLGSGPSAITLNSAGSKDIYLLKQNCSGVPVWAVRIGGSGNEAGTFNHGDLVVNNSTGALYVTASFEGNCSFGTTSGSSITKSTAGATDAFIACYNTNGVISWVNSIGSSSDDQGTDIILDTTGALICSGLLSGTCSFGTQSGSAGSLTSTGNTDGYIARYSSSGQFLNAIKVGGTQLDLVIAINLDRSSNIIASIATCCSGSVQVGPFTLNNTGAWGGVVAKLSSNMSNWLWAAHIGGSGDDVVGFTNIDDSNNVYVMYGSASTSTLNSTGGGSFSYTPSSMDIIFAKLNLNGVLQWAQKIGGSGYEQPYCSWYDSKRKKFYWGGWFGNTVTFGVSPNTQTITSSGNRDQFVVEYDINGTFNWALKGGSSGDDLVTKIATDTAGAVYFTGLYAGAASYSPFSLSSSGSTDANICKISTPYTTDSVYASKTTLCGNTDSTLILSGGIKPGTVSLQWLLNNSPIPGATNASLYASATGQYKIVGTNSCGEKDTSSAITIIRVFANAGPDLAICKGDSVQIQGSAMGSYSWYPSVGLSNPLITNPYAKITATTSFILTSSIGSCTVTDTLNITALDCPRGKCTYASLASTSNMVVNGNFQAGNTGFTSGLPQSLVNPLPNATYVVGPSGQAVHFGYKGNDHTTGSGNMMIVNGGSGLINVWCQQVAVQPNTFYRFSAWFNNIVDHINYPGSPIAYLELRINGVKISKNIPLPETPDTWVLLDTLWYSGNSYTADLCIVDTSTSLNGNDFAIDDISFKPCCAYASLGSDLSICKGDTVPVNGVAFGNFSWSPASLLMDSTSLNTYTKPDSTIDIILTAAYGSCMARDTMKITVLPCPKSCTYTSLLPVTNLVTNGDFQAGNTGFTSGLPQSLVNPLPNATYAVGPSGQAVHFGYKGNDHTTGSGNMMIVNGGSGLINVWCQQVAVQPNTFYRFSAWFNNIVDHINYPNAPIAYLELRINGIKVSKNIPLPDLPDTWVLLDTLWYSGNNTMANLCIFDTSTSLNGNDFAVDDISFKRCCDVNASAGPDKTITPGDSVQLEGEATGTSSYRWQPATYVNDSTLLKPYAKPSANTAFVFKAGSSGCFRYDTAWVFLDSATCVDCSAPSTINSGLVACYTFDGDANDKSGNNNHGIIHGGLNSSSDRWGNPNKAYDFNGIDAYISVPNSASLSSPSSEITVSAWVYVRNWSAISASTQYAPVLAKSDNANTLQYLLAAIDSGIDACHQGRLAELNIHAIQKNKWYHLAFTVNSAHLAKYYLDGILLGSTTSQVVPLFSLSNNNPLYIGRDEPVSTEYLDGKLDDIRIYNRALSDAEIRSLHHSNLFEDFADAGIDSNICADDSLQLQGKGGNFYAWHKASGLSDTSLQKPFVKPLVNTEYILEVRKGACRDKDSVQINITNLTVNAGVDTSFCTGDSVQLNALAPGAVTWTWSPANGLSNSSINNPYAQPAVATMYLLSVSDGKCNAKDTLWVSPYSISVNAGRDSSICSGDSIQIGLSSDGNTFAWSPATGLSATNILKPKAAPGSTVSYILKASQKQCHGYDTVTITILPRPTVTASDTIVCINSPVKITTQSNDPTVRYKWNTGDTLSFLDVLAQQTSKFWVQVSNNACKSAWDTAQLTVQKAPNPNFIADPISGKAPLLVNFSAVHAGAGNYYWYFGDTSTVIGRSKDTSYEYQDTGTYVVKLVTESPLGCKDSSFALITAFDTLTVFIPSAFSPNGDGINDLWYPSVTGMKYYELIIFDRWGEILYQQDSRKGWPAWNGKFRNELVPDGVYAYLLRYISEKRGGGQKIGTITIIH